MAAGQERPLEAGDRGRLAQVDGEVEQLDGQRLRESLIAAPVPVAFPVDLDRLLTGQFADVDAGIPALGDSELGRAAPVAGVLGVGLALVREDERDRPLEELSAIVYSPFSSEN